MFSNLAQKVQLLNFGIGNEKSLLCTSLSILLALLLKKSIIILNNWEYLTFRDYNKFKEIIKECKLHCSCNQLSAKGITFLDEKHFKSILKKSEKKQDLLSSILIIDEYD